MNNEMIGQVWRNTERKLDILPRWGKDTRLLYCVETDTCVRAPLSMALSYCDPNEAAFGYTWIDVTGDLEYETKYFEDMYKEIES